MHEHEPEPEPEPEPEHEHEHDIDPPIDGDSWNECYRASPRVWSGNPNPQLVVEAGRLTPGRALDVGCGEGADAIWLARHGWDVMATDISGVALERAARHAADTDAAVSARIEWKLVDLLVSAPEPDSFDLVSAQFMQLPPVPRDRLFSALAAAVRRGGSLLVVGHHPSDLATAVRRPRMPDRFYTADDVAVLLDASWNVVVREARPRPAATPGGDPATVHDAVLLATRH
jgi:SAM-dependent methyltransferase